MSGMKTGRPARFRRPARPASVESLVARLEELALEREELHSSNARPAALERNRIAIARTQWELSHALIDRHSHQPAA
jgi:hypothetical protein